MLALLWRLLFSAVLLCTSDAILSLSLLNLPSPHDSSWNTPPIVVTQLTPLVTNHSKKRTTPKTTRRRGEKATVCQDEFIDCKEFEAICEHAVFNGVMRDSCRQTCNLCFKQRKNGVQSTRPLVTVKPSPSSLIFVRKRIDDKRSDVAEKLVDQGQRPQWYAPTLSLRSTEHERRVYHAKSAMAIVATPTDMLDNCDERLPHNCVLRRVACARPLPGTDVFIHDACAHHCAKCNATPRAERRSEEFGTRYKPQSLSNADSTRLDYALVNYLRQNVTTRRLIEEILPRLLKIVRHGDGNNKHDDNNTYNNNEEDEGSALTKLHLLKERFTKKKHTINGICVDRVPNCIERVDLCVHTVYWRLMRRVCARSCGFCVSNVSPTEFK